jgi:hypothetical protein
MAVRHVPAIPEESAIDLNAAIAQTEDEVMRDAMGEDPLDNDGDHSLEEMGEGLEGEVEGEGDEDGEDGSDEGDDAEQEDEAAAEGAADDEDADAEQEGENQPIAARGQEERPGRHPGVPPHRLREATEQARAAQQRAERLEAQLSAVSAQLAALAQRPAQPPAQPQPKEDAEPDMFADPKAWREWNDRRTEQRAQQIAQQITGSAFQQESERRINASMHEAATGQRGYEFREAYARLTSLNPADPAARATVSRIVSSRDPGQALLDWFEQNGGAEWREQLLAQLSESVMPNPLPRRGGAPAQRGRVPHTQTPGGARPRVAFEGPRPARMPSLNDAAGSGRQQDRDPEMFDNSDASVMRYALR